MSPLELNSRIPIDVFGVGAIGRMHIDRILHHPNVRLCGVADPSDAAVSWAMQKGINCFKDPLELLDKSKPKAVIIATPNPTHAEYGLACIERGIPVLIEKPIVDTLEIGQRLCTAADEANVPILVGHHRRYNPILRRAKELITGGLIGRPVTATAMATWLKPDDYYEMAWRRQQGGGPILINMIHDIDLLGHLLGDVLTVQAQSSNAIRNFEVEDTASALLRFECGALCTISVSDAAVAPWNWDLAAGEATHYAKHNIDSMFISGTEASLTIPRLQIYSYKGKRGWHEPLTLESTPLHNCDPYSEQLRHLRAVTEGLEKPVCSGWDGLRTLQVTLAVVESARSEKIVSIQKIH